MSHPHAPDGITYEPLPLTAPEAPLDPTFRPPQPNSPGPQGNSSFPSEEETLYPPQPRFLAGTAQSRDSYASASSHTTYPSGGSEAADSVYGLGPAGGYRDNPRDSYYAPGDPSSAASRGANAQEKRAAYAAPRTKSKRKIFIIAICIAVLLLLLAVVIPVYFAVVKPKNSNSSGTKVVVDENGKTQTVPDATATSKPVVRAAVSGQDGSTVTMDDGTTFKYANKLGGHWYYDEFDPLNNGAKANSYTPALNETWDYSLMKMRGVNLGGWLVMEPFISPAPWEKYMSSTPPPLDEYDLSVLMRADTSPGGGIQQIEEHYKTFITEKDFAEIAAAGLNWVRIPIAYWAIETRAGEPFLEGVSWTYFLKAIKWARKYGLRINLDFHGHAGSQNGWNHSGKFGTINILRGPMGLANAERALDYIRIFAEFISQPEYKDVIPVFGIMNEPRAQFMGNLQIKQFYKRAYDIVRNVGGMGAGNGPYVVFHDGFLGVDSDWGGYLPNSDRVGLDTHQYIAFDETPHGDHMSAYVNTPCTRWGEMMNKSMSNFGHSNSGEYSNAATDCGYWLNGVGLGTRYEGNFTEQPTREVGSSALYKDYDLWDQPMKDAMLGFALSSMDAMRNYFFWTWKIGVSDVYRKVQSPEWSYQLGLAGGWMPKDPRDADGVCGNTNPWTPPLKPWQTGGAGAGDIPASVVREFAWPPASISDGGAVGAIPSYTRGGAIKTLSAPAFTTTQKDVKATITGTPGNGWFNKDDTDLMMVEISTCNYLNPWIGPTAAVPAPLCGGAAKREETSRRGKAFGRASPSATATASIITSAPRP